jgi:hypothetical protein
MKIQIVRLPLERGQVRSNGLDYRKGILAEQWVNTAKERAAFVLEEIDKRWTR